MALSEDKTGCFSIIYWVVPEAIVPTIFPKYFWEQMVQLLALQVPAVLARDLRNFEKFLDK